MSDLCSRRVWFWNARAFEDAGWTNYQEQVDTLRDVLPWLHDAIRPMMDFDRSRHRAEASVGCNASLCGLTRSELVELARRCDALVRWDDLAGGPTRLGEGDPGQSLIEVLGDVPAADLEAGFEHALALARLVGFATAAGTVGRRASPLVPGGLECLRNLLRMLSQEWLAGDAADREVVRPSHAAQEITRSRGVGRALDELAGHPLGEGRPGAENVREFVAGDHDAIHPGVA